MDCSEGQAPLGTTRDPEQPKINKHTNNSWVEGEVLREIRKYFELSENEDTT